MPKYQSLCDDRGIYLLDLKQDMCIKLFDYCSIRYCNVALCFSLEIFFRKSFTDLMQRVLGKRDTCAYRVAIFKMFLVNFECVCFA